MLPSPDPPRVQHLSSSCKISFTHTHSHTHTLLLYHPPVYETPKKTKGPDGKYTDQIGQLFCKDCPLGRFANPTSSRGKQSLQDGCSGICPSGKYGDSVGSIGPAENSCTTCPPGTQNPHNASEASKHDDASDCTACPQGFYADKVMLDACKSCTPGKFQTGHGSSSCKSCPKGAYQHSTGAVHCTPCDAGTYGTSEGQSSSEAACTPCPIARYNADYGSGSEQHDSLLDCLICPTGRWSDQRGQISCNDCPSGSYNPDDGTAPKYHDEEIDCIVCANNTFSSVAGRSEPCAACPVGKRTTNFSKTFQNHDHVSDCSFCEPGNFLNYTSSRCQTCPQGQFTAGGVACLACPSGYHANDNRSACVACIVGRAGENCQKCQAGQFQNEPGKRECKSCPPGKIKSGNIQPAAANETTACQACGAGMFTDLAGQSMCTNCSVNTFIPANLTGLSFCLVCDSSTGSEGATACSFNTGCAPGYFGKLCEDSEDSNTGKEECLQSNPDCQECARGQYAEGDAIDCKTCPAGYYGGSKASSRYMCTPCPSGKWGNVAAGTTTLDDPCEACPKGTYAAPGFPHTAEETGCLKCEKGRYNTKSGSEFASECLLCKAGTWSIEEAQTEPCVNCPAGFFKATSPDKLDCSRCPVGYSQSDDAQSSCEACVPGRAQLYIGGVNCSECEAGKFSNSLGAKECTYCEVGYYQGELAKTTCIACAAGMYDGRESPEDTLLSSCTTCDSGRYMDESAAGPFHLVGKSRTHLAGNNGSNTSETWSDNVTACKSCPRGYYADFPGQAMCRPCLPGKYAPTDMAQKCSPCAENSYASTAKASSCTRCPAGYHTDKQDEQAYCQRCKRGRFSDEGGGCQTCTAGRYSEDSDTSCKDCPGGWVQNKEGSDMCHECGDGKYQDKTDNTTCKACVSNTYTDGTVKPKLSCRQCPAGYDSQRMSSSYCQPCRAGTFNPADSSTCKKCPRGYHRAEDYKNRSRCYVCRIGTFQDEVGRAACKACTTGRFAESAASFNCTSCSVGKMQPKEEATECEFPPVGRIVSDEGSRSLRIEQGFQKSNCGENRDGNYTKCLGSKQCEAGTVGRDDRNGCDSCPPGKMSFGGSISCQDCQLGRAAPNSGSPACGRCNVLANRYSDEEGASSCKVCDESEYSEGTGCRYVPRQVVLFPCVLCVL